jgi:serine/threonine-protein kinase
MVVRYDVGQTVGDHYEVLAPLGQGGMSEVYKARDSQTGGVVVVKIPYASMIGDPAVYSRYQRELEIGKRLDHPNIQRLLADGRLAGGVAPYLVLEYVDGQLLRKLIAERAPFPVDEAVDIALQLAGALEYCHGQGVVHRDLKPENVLVTSEGKVKLADFGIALLRGARRLTYRRFSGEVGTPDYMAPEQVRGERGDERTDVYAVGVILYEMLAGEVPYQGDNALAVMSQKASREAPLLRRARSDVPPALEAVVYRALRREPDERYQTMTDLSHDLRHLDEVTIPEYSLEMPRAPSLGPLPSPLVTVAIVVAVLLALALIGVLAEVLHRGLVR